MRKIIILLIVLLSLIILPRILHAKLVWSRGTGWIDTDTLRRETPHQKYRYATVLMINGKYITAANEFLDISDRYPDSELTEPSQFNAGHAYYLAREYKKAFQALDKLLVKFPGTRRRGEVLEKAYRIASAQMEKSPEKAISMFEKIIEHNPLGPIAVDAQIKIAECHYSLMQYDEAVTTYEKIIENYPKSEWVPYAQFQIPSSKFASSYFQDRDVGLLVQSREGYDEYLATNPEGPMAEEAKKKIEEIRLLEAEKTFNIAEFYYRRKESTSAVIYYKTVLQDYPDTIWAVKAEKTLAFLKSIGVVKK
ncbi:MAG: outer membrane protein assembly factor BamD [Planctomycetes bacterium]|nr:outer membrane protein assembly factor BamD [Planctomycetota bacterium]